MKTKHKLKERFGNVGTEISDDLAKRIVTENPEFIAHCKSHLQDDKELVLSVFDKPSNHYLLCSVSDRLKADKEVADKAIESNINNFKFASPFIQDDKDFAMKAVSQAGMLLFNVSERLKADKEVVLAACKQSTWSAGYAHPSIKELYKDKDPVRTLEAAIKMEKMQEQLKPKAPSQTRAMKI